MEETDKAIRELIGEVKRLTEMVEKLQAKTETDGLDAYGELAKKIGETRPPSPVYPQRPSWPPYPSQYPHPYYYTWGHRDIGT